MKEKSLLKTILRWLGRGVLAILALLVGLITILFIREALLRNKYLKVYPQPGETVHLDTHDVHLYCVGEGRPAVVFESDIDQYGVLSWDFVQGEIGQFTRACSYDRAGILWSDAGPRPRDGERIADELKAVLEAAGEQGPYVLVGHAFGGVYTWIYAGKNPEDVYGMVLLDSGHPDQLTRFRDVGIEQQIPGKQIRPVIWSLSHLGSPGRFKGPRYSLPDEVYEPQQAFLPKSSMAWFDETVEATQTLAQAARYESLGDMPLVVIASARPTFIQTDGRDLQDLWLEMQQELTLLSTNSEFIPLEAVGHYIQYERPEIVIEAVQGIVQHYRADSY